MVSTSPIAYLGPAIDHRDSLRRSMRSSGIELVDIPDTLSWNRRPNALHRSKTRQIATRTARGLQQFAGTRDSEYLGHALEQIDNNGIHTILAYWGIRPLPDIKALKKLRPSVRFILNVLCHPLGLNTRKVTLQNLMMRTSLSSLDGLIFPGTAMQEYFHKTFPRSRTLPSLLQPPCWDSHYFPGSPAPPLKDRPNIVFLGRMDWKAGQPSDNVVEFLGALMNEGIDVNFCRTPESEINHIHAHPFDPIPFSEMASFGAQFDASLIVYNLGVVKRSERFDITVPDRLISSVCAGVPIALPRQGFFGCKEYLSDLGAVIEYDSPGDLACQLRDRNAIARLRLVAQKNSLKYQAERHVPALLNFLRSFQKA